VHLDGPGGSLRDRYRAGVHGPGLQPVSSEPS